MKAAKKKKKASGAKKLVRCTVYLEKAQWKKMKSVARKSDESTSATVRLAVMRFLEGWRD